VRKGKFGGALRGATVSWRIAFVRRRTKSAIREVRGAAPARREWKCRTVRAGAFALKGSYLWARA